MKIKYYSRLFVAVMAAALFTSVSVLAFENPNPVKVSGNINMIDIKLGKLQLNKDASQSSRDPRDFKINRDQTRLTDPTDKKFIKLEDLRVGERVTVEFNFVQGEQQNEPLAVKITADPATIPVVAMQGSTSTTTTTTTTTAVPVTSTTTTTTP